MPEGIFVLQLKGFERVKDFGGKFTTLTFAKELSHLKADDREAEIVFA